MKKMTSCADRRALLPLVGLLAGGLACVGTVENSGKSGPSTPGVGGEPNPNPGTNPGPSPGTMAPLPGTSGESFPPASTCTPGPQRIWPLTPEQYLKTVKAVLPSAGVVGQSLAASLAERTGFSNEAGKLGLTEQYVSELLDTVWELSSTAVTNPGQLAPCLGQAAVTPACHKEFVSGFVARAFRRELSAAETDELAAYLTKEATGDLASGLRRFLMYVFTSPSFVFRTEIGDAAGAGGHVPLTGFERASALSYFLSDAPPDADLYAAARTGALGDKAALEAHARRLLSKPGTASGFLKLFREFFETEAAAHTEKEAEIFPQWNATLGADLSRESDAFLEQALWGEEAGKVAKLSTILTADFSMLNGALATYYGVPAPGGTGFGKVTFKGQRAGILTQAGRMAALAKGNDTDAVMRGRFVREALLCQDLPPPPDAVAAIPPPPDGQNTQRERLAQHSKDASCATCHTLMDPLGLAFENYDGVGRYRTTEVGKTIDASGVLSRAEPEGARFANAIELVNVLARSSTVNRCFVTTAFRYAQGRPATEADKCTIDRLLARFDASGGDLVDLAVALATDDSFIVRQGGKP
jgi:hypothetical protein